MYVNRTVPRPVQLENGVVITGSIKVPDSRLRVVITLTVSPLQLSLIPYSTTSTVCRIIGHLGSYSSKSLSFTV
jgi:hypothetical protein